MGRSLPRPEAPPEVEMVEKAAAVAGALLLAGGGVVAQDASPESVALPAPDRAGARTLESTLAERRSVRDFADEAIGLADVSQLLWAAQGVTDPDGLRTAPSAGALYPLEIHVVAGNVERLPDGIYRYRPREHELERTGDGDQRRAVAKAALGQDWMADAACILVIASVTERTARKYGNRATRYAHLEAGHAGQNVFLQAVALGLGTTPVGAFEDRSVRKLLALPAGEAPLLLVPVGRPSR